MKTHLSLLLGLLFASFAFAQPAAEVGTPKRTPEELRKLLAPIALYPDALVALILPASTNSADLVLAARFLSSQQDPKDIDTQPWDESVKSLARYPQVIKWMDENLVWSRELGEAFAAQPADLMNTVQALRSEAKAAGLLKDTPEQKVVVRDQELYIEPTEDDVIYVPSYDPEVLIARRPVYGSWITFGAGFAVGSWLNFDCDWRARRVLVVGRQPGWTYRPDWRWRDRDHSTRFDSHEWRPTPAYWQHIHEQPRHELRPIPSVRPSHFVESRGDHRTDDQRQWVRQGPQNSSHQGDGRVFNGQQGRSDDHRNDRADLTGANLPASHLNNPGNGEQRARVAPPAPTPGGSVGYVDHRAHPVANPTPSAPVAAPNPAAEPAQNSAAAGTQNWRQIQEHRLNRPVEANGQRTYPHQIINPPAQHVEQPAEARLAPQPAPAQRVSGYTRREAPSPSPVAPQWSPMRGSAPTQVAAPAPAAAVAPSAPVQRGDGGSRSQNVNSGGQPQAQGRGRDDNRDQRNTR